MYVILDMHGGKAAKIWRRNGRLRIVVPYSSGTCIFVGDNMTGWVEFHLRTPLVTVLRLVIRIYQLSLSSIFGRGCRHLPTCSEYADAALARYGAWAGLWMALARFWRCRPLGSHGFDPIPEFLPPAARWYTPWRYGRWSGGHIEHTFFDPD